MATKNNKNLGSSRAAPYENIAKELLLYVNGLHYILYWIVTEWVV